MSHDLYANSVVVVPANLIPLVDSNDFKTIKASVAYDAAGMDLKWNFLTPGGVQTQTAVTPTSSGSFAWSNFGGGMYGLSLPVSLNNQVGTGWVSGVANGVLPFAGLPIKFKSP